VRTAPLWLLLGRLDDGVVLGLNRFASTSRPVRLLTAALARWLSLGEIGLMLLLAVAGRRGAAVRMLLGVGIVYLACDGLGRIWPRQRPFDRLDGVHPLVPHSSGRSFPSRHVASGLAMAAFGMHAQPGLGGLMRLVAWLLGVSRVMAGLHYPSDVVCGALLARGVVWLVRRLSRPDC
jgi:membrane-associated phospholipid phosphatase